MVKTMKPKPRWIGWAVVNTGNGLVFNGQGMYGIFLDEKTAKRSIDEYCDKRSYKIIKVKITPIRSKKGRR